MSLATYAANGGRSTSFLPAIKCSNCGDEIEIARMGEHLCGPSDQDEPPLPPPGRGHSPNMSNPFTLRQMNASGMDPMSMPTPLQYGGQLPYASSSSYGLPAPAPAAAPVSMPMPFGRAEDLSPDPYMPPPPPRDPLSRSASPASQHRQPVPMPRLRAPTLTSTPNMIPKPPKMNLPRINPDAANRPFLAPRTPIDGPPSPAITTRSATSNGKPALMRSQTSPMPRLWDPRPPSPELSANLDCAFPPFPTAAPPKKERRPSASQGRRTPAPSERAPSRGGSRLDQVMNAEPEPFNLTPQSPTLPNLGDSLFSHMNAPIPGPSQAPSREGSRNRNDEQPTHAQSPPNVLALDALEQPTAALSLSEPRRPSIPAALVPSEYTLSNTTYSATKKEPPVRPDRPQDGELSPRFLSSFSAEPLSLLGNEALAQKAAIHGEGQASQQNQNEEVSHTLSKARSEPSLQERIRRPSMPGSSTSDPSQAPQLHQVPPRGDSRNGTRIDYRIQNAPPVPKPVQQYRQGSKHAPSESGSSTSSTSHSMMNSNSSTMSPVGSAASSVEAFSPLNDMGRYGDDDKMRVDGLSFRTPPGALSPIEEQPRQILPPRNFARPVPPRDPSQQSESEPMESPMDPMLQGRAPGTSAFGSIEPPNPRPFPTRTQTAPGPVPRAMPAPLAIPTTRPRDNDSYKSNSPLAPSPSAFGPSRQDSLSADEQTPDSMQPPPIPGDFQTKRPPARRGTIGKAVCRGCSKLIEGKSVKAADGRLTGRWHKACFVCRTCQNPFTTADFYVINDQPYCEHHYHQNNNSLCHGCNRGIEGQYTETTSSSRFGMQNTKYHPRCFTCRECRVVLEDDYFEIQGNVFCERHALAAMRAQARLAGPGLGPPERRGLMAERRTTKLMMMNAA